MEENKLLLLLSLLLLLTFCVSVKPHQQSDVPIWFLFLGF